MMNVSAYESYAAWFNSIVDILPQNTELLPAYVKIIPVEGPDKAKEYQKIVRDYKVNLNEPDPMGRQVSDILAENDADSGVVFRCKGASFPMGNFYRDLWSQCGEHQFTLTLNPVQAN